MYNHAHVLSYAGYYCESGVDRPSPGSDNSTVNCSCPGQAVHTGIGGVCPLGHYCPLASPRALPCEAGSYADREGMALCSVCPEGFYCLANSSDFLSQRCPTGQRHSSRHWAELTNCTHFLKTIPWYQRQFMSEIMAACELSTCD